MNAPTCAKCHKHIPECECPFEPHGLARRIEDAKRSRDARPDWLRNEPPARRLSINEAIALAQAMETWAEVVPSTTPSGGIIGALLARGADAARQLADELEKTT